MNDKPRFDTRTKIGIAVAFPVIIIFWILTAVIVFFYPYWNLVCWIANGYGLDFKKYYKLFSPMGR